MMRRMRFHQAAFTLLELLIAIVVVGVLGSIAISIYHSYLDLAKRSEGMADIG